MGDKLKKGRLSVRDIVHTYEEEFEEIADINEEELRDKTMRLLDEAAALYEKLLPMLTELKKPNISETKEKRLKGSIRQIKKELSEKFDEVNLHPRQVELVAQKLRDYAWSVMEAEKDIRACARRAGVTIDELHNILSKPQPEKGSSKSRRK